MNVEAKFKSFEPTEEMKQPSKIQNKVVIQIAGSMPEPTTLKHQEAIVDDGEEKKIKTIAYNIYAKRTRDLLLPYEPGQVKSETVSVFTSIRTNPNPVNSML